MLTSEEKWELLGALYRHGSNLEALKEALPRWSSSKLKFTLQRYHRRSAKTLATQRAESEMRERGKGRAREEEQRGLEQWQHLIQRLHRVQGTSDFKQGTGRRSYSRTPRDHSPLLAKVMACVASLEDHPHPAHPGQPNYTTIYRYLAQTLAGEEPTELDAGSASRVSEVMGRVRQGVIDMEDDLTPYLHHLHHLPPETLLYMSKRMSRGGSDINPDNMISSVEERVVECPLFQDPEEDDDDDGGGGEGGDGGAGTRVELDPKDPYYQIKRDKLLNKVRGAQEEGGATLSSVPGLNPLKVPPSLLVKPTSFLSPNNP